MSAGALAAQHPSAPPAPARTALSAPDAARASLRARSTGQRVEITADTTETDQTFAEPDGTLTLEEMLEPVRVQGSDGRWVPLDGTLIVVDGRIRPVTASVSYTLSAGGQDPLVSMEIAGRTLALSWPGTLPVPTISGQTVTYANVLSGVDLQVDAEDFGFSERLVVRTRDAITSGRLAHISFTVTTDNLTLAKTADDGLAALSATGGTLFQAPPAEMWSEVPGTNPDSGLTTVRTNLAPVVMSVASGQLTLTPDSATLTSPSTPLPIVIDPSVTSYHMTGWTQVFSSDPASSTWRTADHSLAMGLQDFESPHGVVRTFLQFPLGSAIWGTHVNFATLAMTETHSGIHACSSSNEAEIWATGPVNASTTWNNQPSFVSKVAHSPELWGNPANPASPKDCRPDQSVAFTVTSTAAAVAARHTPATFGLKSTSESSDSGWRKFASSGAGQPKITVNYNHPPVLGTLSTQMPNSTCQPSGHAPHINVTPAGITLRATGHDPDGTDQLTAEFQIRDASTRVVASGSHALASGVAALSLVPTLTDQAPYYWVARIHDNNKAADNTPAPAYSPWSAPCWFIQDRLAPNAPAVTSPDAPPDEYSGVAGQAVRVSFTPNPSPGTTDDTVGYSYALDNGSPVPGVFNATDHTGTGTVLPTTYGPHDVWVQARDAAGNTSSPVAYHFYVNAPNQAVAHWRFEEGGGTQSTGVVDTNPGGPSGPVVTLDGDGPSLAATGKIDGGLSFTGGTTGSATATLPATLDTSQAFSITAWVKLNTLNAAQDAVSISGATSSSLYLQLRPDTRKWSLATARTDTNGAAEDTLNATTATPVGEWHHLAAVATTLQDASGASFPGVVLYIDGVKQGQLQRTPWTATGRIRLGDVQWNGAPRNRLNGTLDEVRIYDRALNAPEIVDIVNHDRAAVAMSSWHLDDGSGSTAADTGTPGGHPATLTDGARFDPTGKKSGALLLDGVAGSAHTQSAVVDTTGTFTVASWVKLDDATASHVLVSQDAESGPAFTLEFVAGRLHDGSGTWRFSTDGRDSATQVNVPAVATAMDPTGWTHLTASFDAFTRVLSLRVDDSFDTRLGIGFDGLPNRTSGALQFGLSHVPAGDGADPPASGEPALIADGFLAGRLDEVAVFAGIPSLADQRALACLPTLVCA